MVERVADVLLGQQQGALVARQRGVGLRLDGAQAGPHVAQAERRPTDAGRQFEGARGAAEVAAAQGEETDEAAQVEARIEFGGGRADVFGARCQLPLGADYVGALEDQAVDVAQRQVLRQWRGGAAVEDRRAAAGCLAAQHVEAIAGALQRGRQWRNRRFAAQQVGLGVLHVLRQAAAQLQAAAGQLQGVAPTAHLGARHVQPALVALDLEVGAGGVGGDAQAYQPEVGVGRFGAGQGGVGKSAEAAEQVDFPLRVEAGAVALRQAPARLAVVVQLLFDAAAVAGLAGDLRQLVEPAVVEQRAGAAQVGAGLADVVVARQRLVDQAHQLRIVEETPPGRFPPLAGELAEVLAGDAWRRRLRTLVVGADAAGGQAGADRQGQRQARKVRVGALHALFTSRSASASCRLRGLLSTSAWLRASRV